MCGNSTDKYLPEWYQFRQILALVATNQTDIPVWLRSKILAIIFPHHHIGFKALHRGLGLWDKSSSKTLSPLRMVICVSTEGLVIFVEAILYDQHTLPFSQIRHLTIKELCINSLLTWAVCSNIGTMN